MLRIAICDDEPGQIVRMKRLLETYCAARDLGETQVETFDNPLMLLESLDKRNRYDIALLDICMPGLLGIEVARDLRQRLAKIEIIFMTTSTEFAVDAFALKAAHYLVKPVAQAAFDEAMDRALTHIDLSSAKLLTVRSTGGVLHTIDIQQILYIESKGHTLNIRMAANVCTENRRSLERFAEELESMSPGQFIAPYKGYIVNQDAIASILPRSIVLTSGDSVPLARGTYRAMQATHMDYIFGAKRP